VSFTYSIEIISIKNFAAHVYIGEYIGYIGLCGVTINLFNRCRKMRVAVILSGSLLFTLLDIMVTTILYVHGSSLDIFSDELEDFDIHRSTLDLWGTVLIRVSLLFGGSIGVFFNRNDGPRRVSNLGTLVALICLTNMTYALAKLLMFSEEGALMYDPWFLSLFSWTCASSIGIMISWSLLSKTPNAVSDREDSEETEGLVDGIETEDESSEKSSKSRKKSPHSGATIGRLLSYCKKDSGLLAIAFFFLLLSAVCKFTLNSFSQLYSMKCNK